MERRTAVPQDPGRRIDLAFGLNREGLAYYLVIEHTQQVAVLEVHWFS